METNFGRSYLPGARVNPKLVALFVFVFTVIGLGILSPLVFYEPALDEHEFSTSEEAAK